LHTLEIGLHTLFIGEIRDVKGEADVLDAEGKLDILKVKPLIFAPDGGSYYGSGHLWDQPSPLATSSRNRDH
jgi:flavin reductase (DIM6/NTAB) family NADH-FMN oxidoreductase RutF